MKRSGKAENPSNKRNCSDNLKLWRGQAIKIGHKRAPALVAHGSNSEGKQDIFVTFQSNKEMSDINSSEKV